MQLNRQATKLLLAATGFTARQVPLLRGNIVITGNDGHGDLAGLTNEQVDFLINSEPNGRDEWILGWRYSRDMRVQRRAFRATEATRRAAILRPWR